MGIALPVDPYTCELREDVWARCWRRTHLRRRALRGQPAAALLYMDCGNRDEAHLHFGARVLSRKLRRWASHTPTRSSTTATATSVPLQRIAAPAGHHARGRTVARNAGGRPWTTRRVALTAPCGAQTTRKEHHIGRPSCGAYLAPPFPTNLDWINTGAGRSRLEDLRGKLLLLDFWTYG